MLNPSKAELSELKDQLVLFRQNPIWQHILAFMQAMYASAAEEALSVDFTDTKRTAAVRAGGMAQAIKQISQFDDYIPVLRAAKELKE